jgi:hypothetical protein
VRLQSYKLRRLILTLSRCSSASPPPGEVLARKGCAEGMRSVTFRLSGHISSVALGAAGVAEGSTLHRDEPPLVALRMEGEL